ncbi:MAG: hypothetical protein ABIG03_00675 [Candidatus Eisenbacteria bacterium]
MSEGSSNGNPKTLADVSHLFFSGAGAQRDEGVDAADRPTVEVGRPPEHADTPAATRVFVVTGADAAPGKSTVAVNVAQSLVVHGRTGLYDADSRVPNARFYLGLPSWHYLSPLTGGGTPAPNVLTDSGLVVVDGVPGADISVADRGGDGVVSAQLPGGDACVLDYAVVDAPLSAAVGLAADRGLATRLIVVSRPGERGFFETHAVLARLAREAGVRAAGQVVNRAPSTSYARAFHAKTRLAAERLLSVDVSFLGGLVREPDLGALQRERGVMVRSRPDATSALLLREIASNALELREAYTSLAGGPESSA